MPISTSSNSAGSAGGGGSAGGSDGGGRSAPPMPRALDGARLTALQNEYSTAIERSRVLYADEGAVQLRANAFEGSKKIPARMREAANDRSAAGRHLNDAYTAFQDASAAYQSHADVLMALSADLLNGGLRAQAEQLSLRFDAACGRATTELERARTMVEAARHGHKRVEELIAQQPKDGWKSLRRDDLRPRNVHGPASDRLAAVDRSLTELAHDLKLAQMAHVDPGAVDLSSLRQAHAALRLSDLDAAANKLEAIYANPDSTDTVGHHEAVRKVEHWFEDLGRLELNLRTSLKLLGDRLDSGDARRVDESVAQSRERAALALKGDESRAQLLARAQQLSSLRSSVKAGAPFDVSAAKKEANDLIAAARAHRQTYGASSADDVVEDARKALAQFEKSDPNRAPPQVRKELDAPQSIPAGRALHEEILAHLETVEDFNFHIRRAGKQATTQPSDIRRELDKLSLGELEKNAHALNKQSTGFEKRDGSLQAQLERSIEAWLAAARRLADDAKRMAERARGEAVNLSAINPYTDMMTGRDRRAEAQLGRKAEIELAAIFEDASRLTSYATFTKTKSKEELQEGLALANKVIEAYSKYESTYHDGRGKADHREARQDKAKLEKALASYDDRRASEAKIAEENEKRAKEQAQRAEEQSKQAIEAMERAATEQRRLDGSSPSVNKAALEQLQQARIETGLAQQARLDAGLAPLPTMTGALSGIVKPGAKISSGLAQRMESLYGQKDEGKKPEAPRPGKLVNKGGQAPSGSGGASPSGAVTSSGQQAPGGAVSTFAGGTSKVFGGSGGAAPGVGASGAGPALGGGVSGGAGASSLAGATSKALSGSSGAAPGQVGEKAGPALGGGLPGGPGASSIAGGSSKVLSGSGGAAPGMLGSSKGSALGGAPSGGLGASSIAGGSSKALSGSGAGASASGSGGSGSSPGGPVSFQAGSSSKVLSGASGASASGLSPSDESFLSAFDARAAKFGRGAHLSERIIRMRQRQEAESKVIQRLDKLEASLARARPLSSKGSADLQATIARLDAQIAKLRGVKGKELAKGAREVAQALGKLSTFGRGLPQKSANMRDLQKALDERQNELARLAFGEAPDGAASPGQLGAFKALRNEVPGLHSTKPRAQGNTALTNAALSAATTGNKEALIRSIAPGQASAFLGMRESALKTVDELRSAGFPIRRKGWFDSALGSVKKFAGGAMDAWKKTTKAIENPLSLLKSAAPSTFKTLKKIQKDGIGLEDLKHLKSLKKSGLKDLKNLKKKGNALLDVAEGNFGGALDWASGIGKGALGKLSSFKDGALSKLSGLGEKGLGFLNKAKEGGLGMLKGLWGKAKGAASVTGDLFAKGWNLFKSSKLGQAAGKAWDLGKQGMRAIGNVAEGAYKAGASAVSWVGGKASGALGWLSGKVSGAASWIGDKVSGAANWVGGKVSGAASWVGGHVSSAWKATGNVLSGAWSKVTGVVGAVGGRIKGGLSTAIGWIGDKAQKLGGALLKSNPTLNKMWGWAKKAGNKITAFGKAAWEGTKKVGKAVGGFLQSPAGQLLTTGLSLAASFIPGGLLVKAGIGAIMGAVEAVAKGGGLKEALMGAAVGGIEGAVPFLKLGLGGKLGLGAIKGGLSAAANGEGFGGIVKGAFGGALELGGMGLVKKFGGGRGLNMLDKFITGGGKKKGALGLLQKFTDSKLVQKGWNWGKKNGDKLKKAGVWIYDKTGKMHGFLEKVHAGGEYAQMALTGISDLTAWGAEKAGEDSGFGKFLGKLSDLSGKGAEALEQPLEYVKTVDGYVEKIHEGMGKGLTFMGVGAKEKKRLRKEMEKESEDAKKKRKLQRKHADKLKEKGIKVGKWDRVLNVFEGAADKFDEKKGKLGEAVDKQLRKFKQGLGKTDLGQWMLKSGEKMVSTGLWARGHLNAINEVVEKGTKAGKFIQEKLQLVAMATEGANEDQPLGKALMWVNETADAWQEKLGGGLEFAEKWGKRVDLANKTLGGALKMGGVKEDTLEKNDKKAKVWWGLEKPEKWTDKDGKEHDTELVSGDYWDKTKKGQQKAAFWARGMQDLDQWTEKQSEKILGTEKDPKKARAALAKLEKWRKELKHAYTKKLKQMEAHGVPKAAEGDTNQEVLNSQWGAMMHLAGKENDEDEHKEAFKAYQERKKAAAEAKKDKGGKAEDVTKELVAQVETKVADVAQKDAGEIAKDEKEAEDTLAKHDEQAQPGKPSGGTTMPADIAEISKQVAQLQVRRANVAALRAKGQEVLTTKEWSLAVTLRLKVQNYVKNWKEAGLESLEAALDGLVEFFSGGKPADTQEQVPPPTLPGEPAPGLEQLANDQGVVGEPEPAVAPPEPGGLETIETGGVPDPASGPDGEYFKHISKMLTDLELRLAVEVPQLKALGQAGDLSGGNALLKALQRAFRIPEYEIDRLEKLWRDRPHLAEQLAVYRAKLEGMRALLWPAEGGAEAPVAPPVEEGGDPAAEGGEATPPSGDMSQTPGQAVAGAGDVDTYMDEVVADTYIGSGASTRPIAEGLANNFQFDDSVPEGPTLANEVAGLGGALMGLGESLSGAAGDVKGIVEEAGGATSVFSDIAGTVGGLFGKKDNKLTEGAGQFQEFLNWLGDGAGKVGDVGDKVAGAGEKVHKFGDTWRQKGLKEAAGQVFRKGRTGSVTPDAAKAPVVDASTYADAPKRLDYDVMLGMERFLGGRVGDVKIHTGKGAEAVTKRFDAEAVTIRDHVFFAPGRYNPSSTEGRKLIAHELTHVMQRSRPNLSTAQAEEEAHRAEAHYGTPGMETLDLSQPEADFVVNTDGAENNPGEVRTAKTGRKAGKVAGGEAGGVAPGEGSMDEGVAGEELLDRVGERVYELFMDDLEKEFENR